jgi:hypothetical protein
MAHGSQVASLVLGGLSYLTLTASADPMSKLIIVNFGDPVRGIQYPEKLYEAIDYLVGRDAHVINMSLSTSALLTGLKQRIDQQIRDVLFVVAAGNTVPRGISLRHRPKYPASWGYALDRPNIITVGAADSVGAIAKFSNFGDVVELYAPGCSLRTIDHENVEVTEFGTSMAAGHVSFVSSQIRALGGSSMWPGRVKRRLIAGADHIISGRDEWDLLNEVKAISITHDLIEMISDDLAVRQYLFGSLSDVDLLRQYCDDEDIRQRLNNIQKMTPNLMIDGTPTVRYLVLQDESMAPEYCPQGNETTMLPGLTVDGNPRTDVSILDVRDIVVATIRL